MFLLYSLENGATLPKKSKEDLPLKSEARTVATKVHWPPRCEEFKIQEGAGGVTCHREVWYDKDLDCSLYLQLGSPLTLT